MPNRIIREGILTSSRIAKLGWAEEVLYRRLMSVVDDFGRYFADPGVLRAHCYPRQLNKVSDSDVGKWLHSCVAAGLVRVYSAQDEERYLELLNFGQQVRAKKSKFPNPPSSDSTCNQMIANEHLDVSVSVSELKPTHNAHEAEVDFSSATRSAHPEDWQPDPDRLAVVFLRAGQDPPTNLSAVLVGFNLHYAGRYLTENQRYQKILSWTQREKTHENRSGNTTSTGKPKGFEYGDAVGQRWLEQERERERAAGNGDGVISGFD